VKRNGNGSGNGVSAFESRLLSWTVAIVTVTGIAYWVMKDLMPRTDPYSVLGHPWQPHALAAHVLVAPVVLFALGLIAREHILGGVRNGRGRGRSGLFSAAVAVPVILSGYLLQVVTAPGARRIVALLHLVSGILFALLFAGHLLTARRRRAAAAAGVPPAS
jgi:hypothetical protein